MGLRDMGPLILSSGPSPLDKLGFLARQMPHKRLCVKICSNMAWCVQEGQEIMTVAKLNSRIQSMTALEGTPSNPSSPASQSTAVPGLTPSPELSVQARPCFLMCHRPQGECPTGHLPSHASSSSLGNSIQGSSCMDSFEPKGGRALDKRS